MNWARFSAIAEIASSIAIVATLIYLAVQTQQNTAATMTESRNAVLDADLQIVTQMINDPTIEQSFTKPGKLPDTEAMKLEAFLIGLARSREHQWIQFQNGLLDQQTWESFMSALPLILSYPRTRSWWAYAKENGYFDADFMQAVDLVLEQTPLWPTEYVYPFSYDLE